MTPDLITRLESETEPTRELADEVLLAFGWKKRQCPVDACCTEFVSTLGETFHTQDERRWQSPQRPNPLTSLDAAVSLGRNEREKREILAAIYDNANETYPIARCIMFGCAAALRALSAQQKKPRND